MAIQASIPDSDVAENIIHCDNGSGGTAWTAAQLTTLVNAIDTWLTTGDGTNSPVNQMSNACTFTGIAARDLTTSTGPEVTKSIAHVGTDVNGRVASGLSWALTLRTGLAGRSQRGRIFTIGLTTGAFDGTDKNLIATGHATATVNAYNALIAAVSGAGAGWKLTVLSRFNNGAKRAAGVGTAITSVGYSDLWVDFQRRRSPAHARHH